MKSFIQKKKLAQYFRDQEASTQLPYIYLSAGVSAELFQETLKFAHELVLNLTAYFVVVQRGQVQ